MNKKDLVKSVAGKCEITQKQAKEILEALILSISEELTAGGSVKLVNFGSFTVVDRAARKGRNPQNGESIDIPAKKAVRFKVGKALATSVNGGAEIADDETETETSEE